MATVEKIKIGLIDKIQLIQNKALLEALDLLVSASQNQGDALSDAQKLMLEMSEVDIKNGALISQEAMDKRNLQWLNEM